MRVFVILLLLLALLCPAITQAESAGAPQGDSLSRHIQQQLDSIKLELQKAESQKLADEARQMREDANRQMDRVVKMIGNVLTAMGIVIGVIGLVFTIAGIRIFRTRDETRRAITKLEDELRQRGDTMLRAIEIDARKQADEKIQTLQLPPIGEPVSEDESQNLREVVERLKRLEQTGGRLSSADHVLRARKLIEDGLVDLALNASNDAIAEDKANAEAWVGRGFCLAALTRREEAIQAFDAALKIKPDYYEALYNTGVSLHALGRYEEAIQAFDAALKIKPDYHEALNNKGASLAALNRHDEAIQAYDAALKIKPDEYQVLYNKANRLVALARHHEAIQAYDAALKINPDYHEALYNKGISLAHLGRYDDAIHAYNALLQVKPSHAGAYYNRSCVYSSMEKRTESLADLKRAIELDDKYRAMAKTDEDFKAYWDDPDFKKIVGEGEEGMRAEG